MVKIKRVVIVGGGFTGACSAKKLQNKFDLTLIDTKDYYEFTPGILRTLVEPNHMSKIQILHKDYLKKGKIIIGKVIKITNKEVIVNNKKIIYDYLIISSGSKYESHIKEQNVILPTRSSILNKCYKKLCDSKKILLIGGGIVSVELAAEIATHFNNKEITVIHSHNRLMERQPLKASKYAEKFLKKYSVKIIFNEKVLSTEGKLFVTDKGKKIAADMPFICTGIKQNSEFMKSSFSDKLNERAQIKVNNYLQLEGFSNIFVGGDVSNINEEKLAQNAEDHAKVIVKNIDRLEKHQELVEYKNEPRVMVISLGKYNGILTYKNFVLIGIIPGLLKSIIEWMIMQRYKW